MSDIKEAIRTRILADAGIAAIVGSRLSFGSSDQGDGKPRVVINQIFGEHPHHLLAAAGVAKGFFQISCFAGSSVTASQVMELIRLRMDGFRGMIGEVEVQMCHLDSARSFRHPPANASDAGEHEVSHDYNIGWTISVPEFA